MTSDRPRAVPPRRDLCDLHLHTYYSDGTPSPTRLVEWAVELGLSAIAVTDHDSVAGVAEAVEAAGSGPVEVIAGVELSTTLDGVDVHLLGYFIDPAAPELARHLKRFQVTRRERAAKMAARLTELGCPLAMKDVEAVAGRGSIGRPHVAQALIQAGHVADWGEAFDRYLGNGKPAYVEKFRLDSADGVRLIRQAGGVAVFAHPGVYDRDDLVPVLAEAGIDGLEVHHPKHTSGMRERYAAMAGELGLVATGGSDEHAPDGRLMQMGNYGASRDALAELRRRAARGAGGDGEGRVRG
jgi:predicted metal-dependent phosphoesterase TrpH